MKLCLLSHHLLHVSVKRILGFNLVQDFKDCVYILG